MEDWAAQVIRSTKESEYTDREMRDFIEQMGATMIGVKPACLIYIRSKKCLEFCKTHFTKGNPVAFVIIKGNNGKKQLFIYHKEGLNAALSDAENRRFLIKLAYPADGNVEKYVYRLAKKLRSTRFPHEIGIFFGYPLKDVCGFMGAPIPYRKTLGWRMYGDTGASEEIYYQFRNARRSVRNMVLEACQ